MLLTEPTLLARHDVLQPVLAALARSSIKHVSIVGRRGPLEVSFTNKELREMMNLSQAAMVPLDKALLTPAPDVALTRQQSRTLTLLRQGSKNTPGSVPKSWSLNFFRLPTGLGPHHLSLAHTMLDRAMPTGATSTLATDLVVMSLGYRSDPKQVWYDAALGHLRTVQGRIINAAGQLLRNVYVSRWVATGTKGMLASTLLNAHTVADTILADHFPRAGNMAMGPVSPPTSVPLIDVAALAVLNADPQIEDVPPEVEEGRRTGLVTDYRDWTRVDGEEVNDTGLVEERVEQLTSLVDRPNCQAAHVVCCNAQRGGRVEAALS